MRGPVVAGIALALVGCGCADPALEVYAAASLRDALVEVVHAWEAAGGAPVALNFGPSGGLARQILAARRADVFLSAGELEMERVEEAGLVLPSTRCDLLANRLVVIEPAARESLFAEPFTPAALADERLAHLSIGNPDYVPAGRYAKLWLEREGLWDLLSAKVAPAVDVRAALAAVESGVARAGIVYATDAALSARVAVRFRVPAERAPPVVYPVAGLHGRGPPDVARAFVEFLAGERARALFEARGFVVVGAE